MRRETRDRGHAGGEPGAASVRLSDEIRAAQERPERGRGASNDHVCARQAICFQCFRAGVERARARRQAWSQRALPFEAAAPRLTPREIAHRQRMLDHLAEMAKRA